MIKACIFDFDGTVANTIDSIAYYGNITLNEFGIESIPVHEYNYFAGDGAKTLVERMLRFRNCYEENLLKKVFEVYNKNYAKDVCFKTTVFDGMMDSLIALKNRGLKLGILSNKPEDVLISITDKLFQNAKLDIVWGQVEGRPKKPDPTSLLDILKLLNICPDECMYFGDTNIDIKTGKNAGVFTVGVTWGFRPEKELIDARADAIIDKPSDIVKL